MVINGVACQITDTVRPKPGKHGAAKVIIKAKDPVTGKLIETV